jgi:diguanylate cyclase (GGDEF)-like protein
MKSGKTAASIPLRPYMWVLILGWTILIIVSLWWNLFQYKNETLELANGVARSHIEKDILLREWNINHGFVYAPITATHQPNPYLHLPDREIDTPSGKHLTAINSAYMIRQIYDLADHKLQIKGHFTSLRPLRPENAPDPWEAATLKRFEAGAPEGHGLVGLRGQSYMRLMVPLMTKTSCVTCHGDKGFHEGDVLGGISVSVPMAPIWAAGYRQLQAIWWGHLILWGFGVVSIVLGANRLDRDVQKRKQAEVQLQDTLDTLKATLQEMEQHNRHVTLLNKLGDFLQSCLNRDEAYDGIAQFALQLFPEFSGALFMLNPRKSLFLETIAEWGKALDIERVFTVDKCWALRQGSLHTVKDLSADLPCKHVTGSTAAYLCVPLIAQGEIQGLLHLQPNPDQFPGATGFAAARLIEQNQELALTVARQISLALANLNLRESLHIQAIIDPLTGLYNRRYMEENFERELYRSKRHALSIGLIMVDIDHFKRINDNFGHDAGDVLLTAIAGSLKQHIRREDIPCRYGGEEFLLILPDTTPEVTCQRAEELREFIAALEVKHMGLALGQITASFGVASYPKDGDSEEQVIRAADAALYRAKQGGRNQVVRAESLAAETAAE